MHDVTHKTTDFRFIFVCPDQNRSVRTRAHSYHIRRRISTCKNSLCVIFGALGSVKIFSPCYFPAPCPKKLAVTVAVTATVVVAEMAAVVAVAVAALPGSPSSRCCCCFYCNMSLLVALWFPSFHVADCSWVACSKDPDDMPAGPEGIGCTVPIHFEPSCRRETATVECNEYYGIAQQRKTT